MTHCYKYWPSILHLIYLEMYLHVSCRYFVNGTFYVVYSSWNFVLILFSPFRNSTHVRIQWVSRRRQRRHFNLRWSIMSSSTQSLETRRMHTGSHTECVNPTWGNLPLMSWNTSLQREQKQLLSTWSHTHTHHYTHTHTLIITLVQTNSHMHRDKPQRSLLMNEHFDECLCVCVRLPSTIFIYLHTLLKGTFLMRWYIMCIWESDDF